MTRETALARLLTVHERLAESMDADARALADVRRTLDRIGADVRDLTTVRREPAVA